MANKILFFLVLLISAVFLCNIPGACLAQPADNTKINKEDTSPKELTAGEPGEQGITKQDNKIKSVRGLKIVEKRDSSADGDKNDRPYPKGTTAPRGK